VQNSNVPAVTDPYKGLASNIPADTCGGVYPQEPTKKKGPPLPASNQWSGSYSLSGYKVVCGDQQLTGHTTFSAPSNAVLVIENGQLDTVQHSRHQPLLAAIKSMQRSKMLCPAHIWRH
jgi:hypothetical protein